MIARCGSRSVYVTPARILIGARFLARRPWQSFTVEDWLAQPRVVPRRLLHRAPRSMVLGPVRASNQHPLRRCDDADRFDHGIVC